MVLQHFHVFIFHIAHFPIVQLLIYSQWLSPLFHICWPSLSVGGRLLHCSNFNAFSHLYMIHTVWYCNIFIFSHFTLHISLLSNCSLTVSGYPNYFTFADPVYRLVVVCCIVQTFNTKLFPAFEARTIFKLSPKSRTIPTRTSTLLNSFHEFDRKSVTKLHSKQTFSDLVWQKKWLAFYKVDLCL